MPSWDGCIKHKKIAMRVNVNLPAPARSSTRWQRIFPTSLCGPASLRRRWDVCRRRERFRSVSAKPKISEALVLSERTVENHVGNILTKLRFDSRAQIAVWAVEIGLRGKN